jgi:hypothetical protein
VVEVAGEKVVGRNGTLRGESEVAERPIGVQRPVVGCHGVAVAEGWDRRWVNVWRHRMREFAGAYFADSEFLKLFIG